MHAEVTHSQAEREREQRNKDKNQMITQIVFHYMLNIAFFVSGILIIRLV